MYIENRDEPVISIVTCTLNSEKLLQKALDSVETQSYQYIEHIINDSFSSDRTMEIIEAYIGRNSHRYPIKVIKTPAKGVANALNNGTAAASGDIIHYLHSDDYYYTPDALEKAAAYFRSNPGIIWLTGNFLVEIKGEKIIIPHSHLLKINPTVSISVMNIIHHENTFVKREAINQYGGFCEEKSMNVEYRLWLRMIQDHKPLVVNDQFTVFIIHKGSTSTGNIILFSKAIMRGFTTLQKEKVFPLIGHYEEKELFKYYKQVYVSTQKFLNLLTSGDVINLHKITDQMRIPKPGQIFPFLERRPEAETTIDAAANPSEEVET
jgi:glycosyltransferase involved in cell wall biosynthesis